MKYKANVGIEFPPDRRVEAGEIVSDLPPKSVKWLQEQGLIEPVEDGATKRAAKTPFAGADPAQETE